MAPTAKYRPRDPSVYHHDEARIAPALRAARAANTQHGLRDVLQEEAPGVFSLELFAPAFCEALWLELRRYEHWCTHRGAALTRPNSMNRYGLVLDEIGFEDMLDELMHRYVAPWAALLFPEHGGATLDHHHGFVVDYALAGDRDLALHTDDSDVTLNVCLGPEFRGGALEFLGLRCAEHRGAPERPGERHIVHHKVGRAVVHAGAHRHAALPLEAGDRSNLILWCRSSRARTRRGPTTPCGPWCGAHAA